MLCPSAGHSSCSISTQSFLRPEMKSTRIRQDNLSLRVSHRSCGPLWPKELREELQSRQTLAADLHELVRGVGAVPCMNYVACMTVLIYNEWLTDGCVATKEDFSCSCLLSSLRSVGRAQRLMFPRLPTTHGSAFSTFSGMLRAWRATLLSLFIYLVFLLAL